MADIKETVTSITKSLFETSKDLVSNAKLSVQKSSEEEKLKSIYMEIGKKVHEIYSYGGSLGSFFDEKYRDIIICEHKIKELNEKIDFQKKSKQVYISETITMPTITENNVEAKKVCKSCGSLNEKADKFCLGCGRAI